MYYFNDYYGMISTNNFTLQTTSPDTIAGATSAIFTQNYTTVNVVASNLTTPNVWMIL